MACNRSKFLFWPICSSSVGSTFEAILAIFCLEQWFSGNALTSNTNNTNTPLPSSKTLTFNPMVKNNLNWSNGGKTISVSPLPFNFHSRRSTPVVVATSRRHHSNPWVVSFHYQFFKLCLWFVSFQAQNCWISRVLIFLVQYVSEILKFKFIWLINFK